MTTFTADGIKTEVRQILDDAGAAKFTDGVIVNFVNMAIRKLFLDRPAARYSSPVAFVESVVIDGLETSDTIAIDVRWKSAIVHYTAFLCFGSDQRNTVNSEYAKRELAFYQEAI